jgi:hypothetical protein
VAVGLTTFKGVWQSCCPNIKFMSPQTEVCPICEQHKDYIQLAISENDKLAALDKYSAHLNEVESDRQADLLYYIFKLQKGGSISILEIYIVF